MDMTGTQRIEAAPNVVWAALNDTQVLKKCIPGCEAIERLSDTEFKAKVTLKLAALKASFTGSVKLSDLDPPRGYTISGSGTGGPVGFVSGGARVTLAPEGAVTILTYEVKASLGGKLALGARAMDSIAKKLSAEFFERLSAVVGSEPASS